MRISGSWDRKEVTRDAVRRGIGILESAVEAGYTFFDHADIYGDTTCETIFGEALALHPSWRDQLIVATKCGIIFADQPRPGLPHRYDFSARHIIDSVESSLGRLQMERIDLLMLHRPDYLADPEEVARAFTELRDAGKVREFGVSNFRPSLLSAVQSALNFPLQVNQVEINPYHLDCLTDGTLDQCLEHRITPMAWGPVAGGKVASGYKPDIMEDNYEKQLSLLEALDLAGKAYETERTVIALAWLLRHPSGIVPIVGSTKHDNIRTAGKATELEMDRPTWYRILRAARDEGLA